jgi:hypothetical protein
MVLNVRVMMTTPTIELRKMLCLIAFEKLSDAKIVFYPHRYKQFGAKRRYFGANDCARRCRPARRTSQTQACLSFVRTFLIEDGRLLFLTTTMRRGKMRRGKKRNIYENQLSSIYAF